jgi:hypothetical protein
MINFQVPSKQQLLEALEKLVILEVMAIHLVACYFVVRYIVLAHAH